MEQRARQERQIINRLKRIEGQMRGLQKMVEEQRGCEEILTQIISARTALDRLGTQVVTIYIEECLREQSAGEARESIGRAVELLRRVG